MSKVDELVINYAIYEDAVEYLGTTEVTLPDLEYMTEELSGAGIAGNIEEIIIGHLNAMSTTFNFRTVTAAAVKLIRCASCRTGIAGDCYTGNTGDC